MFEDLFPLAQSVGQKLLQSGALLATAESCTGGMLGAAITIVSGSSQWYDRGFITYSNEAKMAMLDVNQEALSLYGAVSENVAIAMAEGVLLKCPSANVAISITGVAGPSGGSDNKPVGMVCFGLAKRTEQGIVTLPFTQNFQGDRHQVRMQSATFALRKILELS